MMAPVFSLNLGEAPGLHHVVFGKHTDLPGYTLALNHALRTIALLYCTAGGEPAMLTEQQFSDDDFTALLPLLEAYPGPADPGAGDLATCLRKETVLARLSLLGCEVVFAQGLLLRPRRQFVEDHDEDYVEIQVIDLKELLPANERFVINTVHCTMALLTCQDGHARMKREELFTSRQLALLLPILDAHPSSRAYRDLSPDFATAEWLFGPTKNEATAWQLQQEMEHEVPCQGWKWTAAMWEALEQAAPQLRKFGLAVTLEPSYLIVPSTQEGR